MYYLITIIRNFLFSCGFIKSQRYSDIFVLCVGNIRVGGTGKTPMIEYLIRNLQDEFPLSVVSLGYKRKTKGLKEVLVSDTADAVGDEPKQMKEKFPNILFFVNKNRNTAIDFIRKNYSNIRLILLDDAYQYRKTSPNATILLTEYNRPYFNDKIIPYGRLREQRIQSKRANYIIVTKCPNDITQNEKQDFIKKLSPLPYQKVFFSKIQYKFSTEITNNSKLLFVAGIDNPSPAVKYLQMLGYDVILKKYPDHYNFKEKDIREIETLSKQDRIIITTEKDAVKLKQFDIKFVTLQIENSIDGNLIQEIKNQMLL